MRAMEGRGLGRAAAATTAAGLVVVMLVGGCGSDNGQVSVGVPKRTPQAQAVASAAAQTSALATGTFKWVVVAHDSNAGDGGPEDATTTGSFDRNRHLSHLVLSYPSADSTDSNGSDGSTFGPSELVMDGTTEYMKMDGSGAGDVVPGGAKSWISLNIPAPMASQMAGGGVGFLGGGAVPFGDGVDPLTELENLTGGVTSLGSATVDGVPTSHYAVALTAEEAARANQQTLSTVPADIRAQEPTAAELAQLSPAHLEVWIDSSGLIRRFTLSATGVIGFSNNSSSYGYSSADTAPTPSVQQERGSVSMTYDLLTANQPVNIEIPPPDQVFNEDGCISAGSASTSTTADPTAMAKCIAEMEGQTPTNMLTPPGLPDPSTATPSTTR